MDLYNDVFPIHISCFSGLADYLEHEVGSAGLAVKRKRVTSVETIGTMCDAQRLNLLLRTALNVNLLLAEFDCHNPDHLYDSVNGISWEKIIPTGEYLSVVSRIDTKAVNNSMFASLKVKDAIVDRINAKCGSRPDSGSERDNIVVNLFWKNNRAWLYLNTSGLKLADRGYRRIPWKAPMREALAAGIVEASGYDGSQPLVCPMCGSGTLAIEAALKGLNRAPGLLRNNFAFMHYLDFDDEAFKVMRKEIQREARKQLGAQIIATDIASEAIEAARANAKTAGVDHLIEFSVCDFADTSVPEGGGIILMNPEYGMRLGEIQELEGDYKRIGDWFKQKCAGYDGYVFTGNLDLAKKIGLKPSRKIPFWNAKIECRLMKYEIYAGSRR